MTFAYPGFGNTHVERFASGSLIIGYSRNPSKFSFARYTQIVPVEKSTDLYMVIDPAAAIRITSDNAFVWPDGADAPKGEDNTDGFQFETYRTEREAYPFSFGLKASQEADWEVVATHAQFRTTQAMTDRSRQAVAILNNPDNYGSNTDTATDLGGGLWSAATSETPYIQLSIAAAVSAIGLATANAVTVDDLVLVLSPVAAWKMAATDEIRNFVKGSPFSEQVLEGQSRTKTSGLPQNLYGVAVAVEDAGIVTAKKGAANNNAYMWNQNYAALVARPGSIEGVAGGPSFSTLTCFMREELNVEIKEDEWNRKVHGRVVEDHDIVLTAPASGYLITNILS